MLPTEELLEVIQAWDETGYKTTQLLSSNFAMILRSLLKIKPYSFSSA